jgi:hypothetical protein
MHFECDKYEYLYCINIKRPDKLIYALWTILPHFFIEVHRVNLFNFCSLSLQFGHVSRNVAFIFILALLNYDCIFVCQSSNQ